MITMFKGDSMTSRFGRELSFEVTTDLDTTGCSVMFTLNGVSAVAALSNGRAVVELTAAQTEGLYYGTGYAAVALTDGTNIRTIANTIPVRVTDSVADMDNATNTIDISIAPDWSKALEGVNWNAGGSIGALRDFLARVGSALGASVTAR